MSKLDPPPSRTPKGNRVVRSVKAVLVLVTELRMVTNGGWELLDQHTALLHHKPQLMRALQHARRVSTWLHE